MTRFKVGDVIRPSNNFNMYEVLEVRDYNGIIIYLIKNLKDGFVFENQCIAWVKRPVADDVLRYGKFLTDDEFMEVSGNSLEDCYSNMRIRTIKYEGIIYYHKMVDGEVVEFKELL